MVCSAWWGKHPPRGFLYHCSLEPGCDLPAPTLPQPFFSNEGWGEGHGNAPPSPAPDPTAKFCLARGGKPPLGSFPFPSSLQLGIGLRLPQPHPFFRCFPLMKGERTNPPAWHWTSQPGSAQCRGKSTHWVEGLQLEPGWDCPCPIATPSVSAPKWAAKEGVGLGQFQPDSELCGYEKPPGWGLSHCASKHWLGG